MTKVLYSVCAACIGMSCIPNDSSAAIIRFGSGNAFVDVDILPVGTNLYDIAIKQLAIGAFTVGLDSSDADDVIRNITMIHNPDVEGLQTITLTIRKMLSRSSGRRF